MNRAQVTVTLTASAIVSVPDKQVSTATRPKSPKRERPVASILLKIHSVYKPPEEIQASWKWKLPGRKTWRWFRSGIALWSASIPDEFWLSIFSEITTPSNPPWGWLFEITKKVVSVRREAGGARNFRKNRIHWITLERPGHLAQNIIS